LALPFSTGSKLAASLKHLRLAIELALLQPDNSLLAELMVQLRAAQQVRVWHWCEVSDLAVLAEQHL
jgi:hypothetical protein